MREANFEEIVDLYYQGLYRFAFCLSKSEAVASDLTQQTFYVWATKGHQLRDKSKVKSWLYTTLRREFLTTRRRETRHPQVEMELVEDELPQTSPSVVKNASVNEILTALDQLDDVHREPLVLFHIDDNTYKEIAAILEIPIGTVMSRISRGREQLYRMLADRENTPTSQQSNVVSFASPTSKEKAN